MKEKILFGFLGLSLLALPAHADLVCSSADGLNQLEIHKITGQRADAEILFTKNGEEILFGGVLVPNSVTGTLFKKSEYKLFGYKQQPATVTVITKPHFG